MIDEGRTDMLRATYDDFMRGPGGGPTEDEVGDADPFGRDKTYLGVAQTTPITIQADCRKSLVIGSLPCDGYVTYKRYQTVS